MDHNIPDNLIYLGQLGKASEATEIAFSLLIRGTTSKHCLGYLIDEEQRMLSRSRTGLVPLKEVAIDIGIHVSAYRLLKVGSLRSPQGL